jgi:hypothetical protein
MTKFHQFILTICYSIIVISAFTDPSVLNPQLVKRFEYKLSFKGPHLSFKDGTVPFWAFGGSTSDFIQMKILYLFLLLSL